MHEGELGLGGRRFLARGRMSDLRQGVQVGGVVLGDLVARPEGGLGGVRVELLRPYLPSGRAVVVAGHKLRAGVPEAGDAFRRLGAVADGISQAQDALDGALGLGVAQHRLQGGEVGVDVRDDGDAHLCADGISEGGGRPG